VAGGLVLFDHSM